MSNSRYISAGLALYIDLMGPQTLSGGPATALSKPPTPTSNANRLIDLHRSIDGHVHVFFRIPRRPVATPPTSFWFGRREWRKKQRLVVGSRLRRGAAPAVMAISSPMICDLLSGGPRRFTTPLFPSFPPISFALPVCAILASHSISRLLHLR
jgi:hypothetical protein